MTIEKWIDLCRDVSGKMSVRLVLSICLLALAVAVSSPAFEANPLLGKTVNHVREHLPETFDTIRRAMGG